MKNYIFEKFWNDSQIVKFLSEVIFSLCISLIVEKSPSRSEHLYGKTATISTFFKGTMMILHKKMCSKF